MPLGGEVREDNKTSLRAHTEVERSGVLKTFKLCLYGRDVCNLMCQPPLEHLFAIKTPAATDPWDTCLGSVTQNTEMDHYCPLLQAELSRKTGSVIKR